MHVSRTSFQIKSFATVAIVAGIMSCAGCASEGQTGALMGGGIGALAGQAIGNNTEATLIGGAVGTGVGYMIGNEADKKKAASMQRTKTSYGYSHTEVSSLGNTRWKMVSLSPQGYLPSFTSKIIEFRPYGRVITTTTYADGRVEVFDESYRVVGSTLIINRPGYIVNARYSVSGNQMIMSADDFSAVLERIP